MADRDVELTSMDSELLARVLEVIHKTVHEALAEKGNNEASYSSERVAPPILIKEYTPKTLMADPLAKSGDDKWKWKVQKTVDKIADALKKQGGSIAPIPLNELSIFSGIKIPTDFKLPEYIQFDGTGDPVLHLRQYIGHMKIECLGEKQMAMMFQTTLTGIAAKWYYTLDKAVLLNWTELAEQFVLQFSYNTEVDVTTRDLIMTKQFEGETFTEFVARWREKASQMIKRPSDSEQCQIMLRNLTPRYLEHMFMAPTDNFQAFYMMGAQIEDLMIIGERRNLLPERPLIEGKRKFSNLAKPLSKILNKLQKRNILIPLDPKPLPNPLPPNHRTDLYCCYHQQTGHSTDNCLRLRHHIQDLIDGGMIPDPEATQFGTSEFICSNIMSVAEK